MPKSKIAIALNPQTLRRLDALVHQAGFPSRSQAVEAAIEEKLARSDRSDPVGAGMRHVGHDV